MRILCTETDPGLADGAVERLQAAGHDVVRCFDPILGAAGPCVGLDLGDCPLDRPGGVDVVLDVRAPGRPRPVAAEAGVTCALRQRIPLAMAGPAWPNPYARWVVAATGDEVDAVAACEKAVEHGLGDLGDAVAIAACRLLGEGRHPGVDVRAEVVRHARELQVTVHRPPQDASMDGALAVHAFGALREAGVQAPAISVSCTD
jgi:hypothetical protein